VQIVYAHYKNPGPHVLHVTSSLGAQIDFILRGRREFGCVAITTYPTNAEIMAHRLGVEVLRDDRSPFIRYEIGDLAVRGICPCGRIRLPASSEVVEEVRGALLHRNGKYHFAI